MRNLLKTAGTIFVVNRIFTHITPATSFFSSIYFIVEYLWQLLLVFGIAANGVSKLDKIFYLYLIPFFVAELLYTSLYWTGLIEYHSTLEGYAFVNFEIFLVFIGFVFSQISEIKENYRKAIKPFVFFIIVDLILFQYLSWLKLV